MTLLARHGHLILEKWVKGKVHPMVYRGLELMLKSAIRSMSIVRERADIPHEKAVENAKIMAEDMTTFIKVGKNYISENEKKK